MNRKERRIQQSQGLSPDMQQAIALYQAGQCVQAMNLCEAILKVQPKHFDALHLSSVLATQTKNYPKALEWVDKAIKVNPNSAEAFSNRGFILRQLGQWDAALASYNKAIALNPSYTEAYYNRGFVLQALKEWNAAIASYDQTIALKPTYAEAYYNRGVLFHQLGQQGQAIASYDKAIAYKPDYAAYSNLGAILYELGQWDAALVSHEQAIRLKPDCAGAYNNRGNALKQLGRWDAAIASYDKAIALQPDYVEAYSNRGTTLQQLGEWNAALASYDKALALKPDYADGHINKAFTLLLSGDFEHGWQEQEWRWELDIPTSPKRNFLQPLWLGKESLAGKTILLHAEQGLGDTIQFCRYIRMVAGLGARVILEVQKPLMCLFAGVDGVAQLVAQGGTLPPFDYHCPLLSLPLAFKTNLQNIPATEKYLAGAASKIDQWQAKLGAKTQPRIGLVWRGNTQHKNDRNRSVALADLMKHLPTGFHYVSLQKDISDADKTLLHSHPGILHFGDALEDFSDTAALCDLMDVVVSVDTSVAHLSATLGKPTWILLPFVPDWRWLLDRKDSPWYPTARLYRQQKNGVWNDVFERIKADLLHLK